MLVFANILFIGYIVIKGRDKLKEAIKEAKAKRLEEEEKERQEELERLEKKRKEEEEFSKLPDDTNNVSQDPTNQTVNNNTTMHDMLDKKNNAKQQNKLKGKDVDNVESVNGPFSTAKKGSSSTEPQTDAKFLKGNTPAGKGGKGKVSGEEKSSGDSDQPKGPIIKQ